MSTKRSFFNWAKQRDDATFKEKVQSDSLVFCRALMKIFGGFPRQGQKAQPGSALYYLNDDHPNGDMAVIRQLVGGGYIRPTQKGQGLSDYQDQVYLLTKKGFNLVLNEGAEVISDDVISNLSE